MAGRKLLVSLFVVCAALPVAPASAPAGSVPTLAGTTTVSGTTTGMMKVRLPHAIEVSTNPFRNRIADLDVSGRIGGFVLKEDVPRNGIEVMGLSVSVCKSCTSRAEFFDVYDPSHHGFPRHATMPAGDYWLYIVADSAPTTVTLRLPGLSGDADLHPRGRAEYELGAAKDIFESPTTKVKAADHRQDVGRSGIALLAVDVKSGRSLVTEIEQCLSRKRMTALEALRMDNTCDGSGGSMGSYGSLEEKNRSVYVSVDQSGIGRFWNTMSWRMDGDIEKAGVVGFSLAYPKSERTGGKSSGYFFYD